jgi:hypothetical protein
MIAASVGQDAPRLLILLDTLEMQQTHSKYLQTVSRGHEVEIATINSDTIKLKDWDMWNYEKLVIIGGKSGTLLQVPLLLRIPGSIPPETCTEIYEYLANRQVNKLQSQPVSLITPFS